MLNKEQYNTLTKFTDSNPELAEILKDLCDSRNSDLSLASHDLKNKIAFLKTSFQLVEKKNPELSANSRWEKMSEIIEDIIYYMERTSVYRYSMKPFPINEIKLSDVLYALPDKLDDRLENECEFLFSTNDDINLNINYDHLTNMLLEVVSNACEALNKNGEILVESKLSKESSTAEIIISNTCVETANFDIDQAIQPFFTTKEKHVGLGLSILHQTCLLYNATYNISLSNNKTSISIIFNI